MRYNTLREPLAPTQWAEEIDALSLYSAFEQITDGRHARGVRYSVALVLTLIVLGKVTGMRSLTAIAEWVRWRADWLRQVLPGTRVQFPCVATYSNVLRAVDAEQVTQVLASLFTRLEAARRCGAEPSRLLTQPAAKAQHVQVALDGKTLRGTLSHAAPDQRSQHLVALYETQTGVVVAQQAVPDKANEITLEATLLTPTQVQGRIVTADALPTQRACCAAISRFGGYYVLLAKANQPTLEEDVRLFFTEPPVDCHDWRQARTCVKGHGRLEIRELVASTERECVVSGGVAWGSASVLCAAHQFPPRPAARPDRLWPDQPLTNPSVSGTTPGTRTAALAHRNSLIANDKNAPAQNLGR